MSKNIRSMSAIYKRLVKLGLPLHDVKQMREVESLKSQSSGFMDLNYDFINEDNNFYLIALSHYYKQNGDMMADPDMVLKVYPESKMVEPMTFQQDNLGIYQEVYLDDGRWFPKLHRHLTSFLTMWTKNMINQGHYFNI